MAEISVTVVYAQPNEQFELSLRVAEGASVGDVLARAAEDPLFAALPLNEATVGVFGEVCGADRVLRAQDRVEIYRPLQLDPKEARRQRAKFSS